VIEINNLGEMRKLIDKNKTLINLPKKI